MDTARQRHEGLSVIGILFADSVAEGEVVECIHKEDKQMSPKIYMTWFGFDELHGRHYHVEVCSGHARHHP